MNARIFTVDPEEPVDDVMRRMIAGGAKKARREQLAVALSLPSVVTGKGPLIEFPKHARPICIPFGCKWGPVSIEVGRVEGSDQVDASTAAG
jgi:hypothetical protein